MSNSIGRQMVQAYEAFRREEEEPKIKGEIIVLGMLAASMLVGVALGILLCAAFNAYGLL